MRRSVPILLALSLLVGLTTSLATRAAGTAPANLPRVLEQQRALVRSHPDDPAAWNDLGNLLVLAGDRDAAEDAYGRAVELAPQRPSFRYNLALLLQESGRTKQAAEQYRKVLEIDPNNAWAHYQLGAILERQGRDTKAVEQYARAFRLDPRLAFSDVNPSVIGSHLTTEAMLRGYRSEPSETPAPRVYQEPQRIARALVQPEPMLAPEDMPDDGAAMVSERPAPTEPAEPAAAQPAGPRRVLDSENLGDRPVSQATPPGRAGYRPPVQPQASAGRSPSEVRTWRPQPTPERNGGRVQGGTVQGGTVVGGATAAPRAPSDEEVGSPRDPRRRLDVPRPPIAVGSTGRLEMVLDDGAGRAG